MSEYSKERLYWIKLTDRFMTSDTVDYLMSQKDGANYVVLYQMLCLKTVNQNGVLARKLGEIIVPYDVEKIVRDCKFFTIDTVRIALTLYKNLGLIYEQEDGLFRIADFERLIGSTTESAEKKQIQRQKQAQKCLEIGGGQTGGQKADICPPDKEKEIDIELVNGGKLNNNINTTTARACACAGAHERKLTVGQFEQELGCTGWATYPSGDVYVEIRDTLIGLIDVGAVALWEIDRDLIGEIHNSMFKGRERRSINDLSAYIVSILNRKRKEKRGT